MKQNTFKNGIEPLPIALKEDVQISAKEMAAYRYTALKIAYKSDQAQAIINQMRAKKERKLLLINNVITRSFAAAVVIATVCLIVKHSV